MTGSPTRSGPGDHAKAISPDTRNTLGMIRRVLVNLTDGALWRIIGHRLLEGREARDVEVFPGIGIFARPAKGGSPEAIVANPGGGAASGVIVAMRDEATRKKVADLKSDETTAYNSLSRVHIVDDGTVEIRSHAGVARRLMTYEDGRALVSAIASVAGLTAPSGDGGKAALLALADALEEWPVGTQKLKGE
jgi:phage gp45-like